MRKPWQCENLSQMLLLRTHVALGAWSGTDFLTGKGETRLWDPPTYVTVALFRVHETALRWHLLW